MVATTSAFNYFQTSHVVLTTFEKSEVPHPFLRDGGVTSKREEHVQATLGCNTVLMVSILSFII